MEYKFTKDNFQKEVLESDIPVLVDFYADWCGPCQMMAPVVESLSEEKQDVKFVAVDVDEAERLAILYGIASIPCMILFKNGEEKERIVGAVPKAKILEVISK